MLSPDKKVQIPIDEYRRWLQSPITRVLQGAFEYIILMESSEVLDLSPLTINPSDLAAKVAYLKGSNEVYKCFIEDSFEENELKLKTDILDDFVEWE